MACLINSRALGYAIVVALPDDIGVGREGEEALDCLAGTSLSAIELMEAIGREYLSPDLDVPPSINPRPDTKHVLATPDTQNSPTDLLASFRELITHNSK